MLSGRTNLLRARIPLFGETSDDGSFDGFREGELVASDIDFNGLSLEENEPIFVCMLLKGKSYNRGVHTHKLEELLRLQWQAFRAWIEAEHLELPTVYQRQCLSFINCCQRGSNDVAPHSVFSAATTNSHKILHRS